MFSERIVSMLAGFFGVLATALAGIGLYGLLAYTVTRRTREIGIRMALGAGRSEVLGLVLREIAILTGVGIALAAPLSFPLANLAKSMLYGVAPNDIWVLTTAAAVLALTALASGAVPAIRALRVDPLLALRRD